MKKSLWIVVAFVLVFNFGIGSAVTQAKVNKPNITVLKFSGQMRANYRRSLSDRVLTKLIKSNRFDVIDRQNLEQITKFQAQNKTGLVAANTGAEIGKLLGLDKLIVGKVTKYNSEYHRAEYSEGEKIRDAYYDVEVGANIKMLDVETGKYSVATSKTSTARATDKDVARGEALDALASRIYRAFESQFKITANVKNIDGKNIILNQGKNVGIRNGMKYQIYDAQGLQGKRLAVARVFEVRDDWAKARVYNTNQGIEIGALAQEVKGTETPPIKATITTVKNKAFLSLDQGTNIGVQKGMNFYIYDQQGSGKEQVAVARVFKVQDNQAQARMFGELNKIKQGYYAVQTEEELDLKATIIRKDWQSVVINMGQNMGVTKGELYEVQEESSQAIVDPTTGLKLDASKEQTGVIYITQAHDNYAQGKIVKGPLAVEKGMAVEEAENIDLNLSTINFFVEPRSVAVTTNTYFEKEDYDGDGYDGDEYFDSYSSESHSVDTNLTGISYSMYSLATNFRTSFSGMKMSIPLSEEIQSNYEGADSSLSVWSMEVAGDYYIPIIPDTFYVYPGAGLGYATTSQTSIDNYRGEDSLSGGAFTYSVKGGVNAKVGNLNLFGELIYRGLTVDDWEYIYGSGDNTDSHSAETEEIPYPKITFDQGTSFKFGVGWSFSGISGLFGL